MAFDTELSEGSAWKDIEHPNPPWKAELNIALDIRIRYIDRAQGKRSASSDLCGKTVCAFLHSGTRRAMETGSMRCRALNRKSILNTVHVSVEHRDAMC